MDGAVRRQRRRLARVPDRRVGRSVPDVAARDHAESRRWSGRLARAARRVTARTRRRGAGRAPAASARHQREARRSRAAERERRGPQRAGCARWGASGGGGARGEAGRFTRIAALGFDVVYLPPIHPIGTSFRKGRNNALVAAPGDPGSPWAIGSPDGGHAAVEPGLGTFEDFEWFRGEAERLGLEVAIDLAWQCSPDHPWVQEHPEWFRHRPDGTIKY